MSKSKERIPADNPTTAVFDLAEHMADNYYKVIYIKYYAYIFIGITLFLLIILTFSFMAQGNIALVIIMLAVIISGLMLLRVIIFTKNFLDDFNTNFQAIQQVRDIDPLPKVPHGKTALARLESYLKTDDPAISRELKLGLELHQNFSLRNTTWDLGAQRLPQTFGPKGSLTLVRLEKGTLKMKNFIKLETDLESLAGEPLLPERVILLNRASDKYDGISDDLYSYLTEKNHYILKNGKKHQVKLQLFVEHSGRYEIIPLLP